MTKQHDLSLGAGCWCNPTATSEPATRTDPAHVITMHHDEGGGDLFYVVDDDQVPCCADCDEVIEGLVPDPPSFVGEGTVQWNLWLRELPGLGFAAHSHGTTFHLQLHLWRRDLHLVFDGRGRRASVTDADLLAPELIAEIEEHLQEH
jgi:hypothetical protein